MKRYLQPCYLALAMLGMSSLPSLAESDHYCRAPASTKDHAAPMNYPDQFAWQLFLEVNQKAKKEYATLNGKKVELNNAVWETWIDDSDNFPQHPNPATPPRYGQQKPMGTIWHIPHLATKPTATTKPAASQIVILMT